MWDGLVDDAARFPPGDAPLGEAVAAYVARREAGDASYVGSLVVRDTDLPEVDSARGESSPPLAIVSTGGAGQLEGPIGYCESHDLEIAALEIALRDPDDPAGNVRRVGLALGALPADTAVFVELPHVANTSQWLAAADAVAELGLGLKLRTGGVDAGAVPPGHALARWIDAALDRELPFKCTAGLHHAVRHDGGHGFLNVLLTTRDLLDGAGVPAAVERLETTDGAAVAEAVRGIDVATTRRWFTSFGSCDVDQPWADLRGLGLA